MRLGLATSLLASSVLLCTACPQKTAAPPDAAVTAVVDAALPIPAAEATNVADVKRYPDEQPMDHVAGAIKSSTAQATKAVPKGDLIATLKAGDAVAQLAERNGFYRVTFADPKNPSQKLMGWITKFALTDARPQAVAKKGVVLPPCGPDSALVMQDDAPVIHCRKLCDGDDKCTGGMTCEIAVLVDDKGNADNHTHYTVCTPAATPAPPTNAAKDAGVAAHKALPVPAAGVWTIPNPNQLDCPTGFNNAGGLLDSCNKICKTVKDCGPGAYCDSVGGDEQKNCQKIR